jgi:membrane-associated protease RseP (regulator of RpoE activity)
MRKSLAILGIAMVLASAVPAFAAPGGGGRGGGGFGGGGRPGGYGGYGGYRGGYYGGYGWGVGIGVGFGFYDSPWLYAQPAIPVAPLAAPYPVQQDPNAVAPSTTGGPTGMKITNLIADGAAAKGSLRNGDIILSVGTTRTSNFDELRSALSSVNGTADIVFINGENGKLEKLPIKVADGKIGVAVQEVQLPPPPQTAPPAATPPTAAPPSN